MKPALIFVRISSVLLLLTALAKLISAFGHMRILEQMDPIFCIKFRYVLFYVGTLELIVAAICWFNNNIELKLKLITGLATSFLIYRIGLMWIDYHKPCVCLGSLTDSLHVAPETADTAMKVVLIYLLTGSYGALLWHWREKAKVSPPAYLRI